MEWLFGIEWGAIAKIIGIDIMLGVDNAVVIAMACAALSPEVRNKAIAFGTGGAIALRVIFLIFAGFLMGITYVKLLAGAYLLYVGYTLLTNSEEEDDGKEKPKTIWKAVGTIIIADMAMSLDNVLAVSAASQSAGSNAVWYAAIGIALSIPVIIYGAKLLMGFIDKYPIIMWLGAGLLGWIGAEMIISDLKVIVPSFTIDHTLDIIIKFVGFSIVIAAASIFKNSRKEVTA